MEGRTYVQMNKQTDKWKDKNYIPLCMYARSIINHKMTDKHTHAINSILQNLHNKGEILGKKN